ncbi:MAG TPA: metal ABC transporter permease [Alphaproteobacteria bacterium]|nr:metal ABC transporter permease [Alphaproteobacteria bacterium]
MLEYDFMRTAFAAGAIVAIVAGAVGYFLVLRNLTFAGHALSHVGFAGATGAILIGVSALWGLLAFTLAAGIAMGFLGERIRGRDVAVGVILSLALGLGILFLYLYTTHATQATALLFGNVLGVSIDTVWDLLALGGVCLLALGAISRPLLFATLEPELAAAKGVPLRLVSVLFLAIVAVAVAEAAQVVGVLLVFALMVGPAAASLQLTTRVHRGVGLAMILALLETWFGIALAYYLDVPASFCIVLLSCLVYFASLVRPSDAGELSAANH